MGGGAAVRAAAKVAGIGAATGIRPTLNSIPPPAEHSVRSATRPVSAIITSSSAAHGGVETSAHQRPAWELNDWEFAGGASDEEELMVFDSAAAAAEPRVVFGSAPSFSEAKEATNDLKDAIEKVFLTSSAQNESSGAKGVGQTTALSLLQNHDHLEASGCITSQSTVTTLHVRKAFALLNQSPAVQNVVTSIVTDPKVWEAVSNNEALTSFLETQKTDSEFHSTESPRKSNDLSDDVVSSVKLTELSDESIFAENSETRPVDIVDKIKNAVVEMATNVSSFVQNLFGSFSAENVSDSTSDGKAKTNFMDYTSLRASFMALAVMVIMVVVLKRA